ncbi:Endo-beta-1,6-galactanase [Colletotrichum sidae]|uniref:Endo-beta-1,6-galactanase n=1 Tax=Colletotrichum sidae TaxID=1347389 RepID=A0A4V3I3L1_9PEZI|nr:Endo-beta-1,6-galactanase [Colletotrichum sidae]
MNHLASTLVALSLALSATADYTTSIDAKSNRGKWDGWGTSLAWWANRFGDRDDLADIFFTTNTTVWLGASLPGLGLNIVRHNAGASSWNSINGEQMVVSSNMIPSRQIHGHWIDWNSADPKSKSWVWDVDHNQRAMMLKARDRGANRFELFSNSPMWWMTYNHNPAGADDGGENIQSWNLVNHTVYLATIARYAKDNWNVTFETVEPFNEPYGNWWRADRTQEGCHFETDTQAMVIDALRKELDDRNLTEIGVAASDESKYDEAFYNWKDMNLNTLKNVKRINVHGYQYQDGERDGLAWLSKHRGQPIWNTEFGEDDTTGEKLASCLIMDFRSLLPTAWVYWQVLDGGGWGLIEADNESGKLGAAHQKYFVLAQFTRHIRDGMRILDGGSEATVAAYNEAESKLVIVSVNWDDAQYVNFDLGSFTKVATDGAKITRWRTQIGDDGGDRYVEAHDTVVSGTGFRSWFEQRVIQTFEIENVKL